MLLECEKSLRTELLAPTYPDKSTQTTSLGGPSINVNDDEMMLAARQLHCGNETILVNGDGILL
jgi:hypothetical protein